MSVGREATEDGTPRPGVAPSGGNTSAYQVDRVRAAEGFPPIGNNPDGKAIPMLLWCPSCGKRHVDTGEFATRLHHTHACQSCGMVWRPAIPFTVGVQFLPGFKDSP